MPKTRTEFWREKIAKNRKRDARQVGELQTLGWNVVIVWECELANSEKCHALAKRLPYLIEREPMEFSFCDNDGFPMVAEEGQSNLMPLGYLVSPATYRKQPCI